MYSSFLLGMRKAFVSQIHIKPHAVCSVGVSTSMRLNKGDVGLEGLEGVTACIAITVSSSGPFTPCAA
jgi:hypothetical protein